MLMMAKWMTKPNNNNNNEKKTLILGWNEENDEEDDVHFRLNKQNKFLFVV